MLIPTVYLHMQRNTCGKQYQRVLSRMMNKLLYCSVFCSCCGDEQHLCLELKKNTFFGGAMTERNDLLLSIKENKTFLYSHSAVFALSVGPNIGVLLLL